MSKTKTLANHLLAGHPPSDILSADSSDSAPTIAARCRFARGSSIDECASWMKDQVSAWALERFGQHAHDVQVSINLFSPVVQIRCVVCERAPSPAA
jgi:hypothetical protein